MLLVLAMLLTPATVLMTYLLLRGIHLRRLARPRGWTFGTHETGWSNHVLLRIG